MCIFCWQVARCTKIINAGQEDAKYVINVRQIAKFVVGLGEKVRCAYFIKYIHFMCVGHSIDQSRTQKA